MSVTDRVCEILTNANTLRITFWFTGVNGDRFFIFGPDFLMVAMAIRANKIMIVEGVAERGKAIYTARDDGALKANTMYIGPNDHASQSFAALVVHETVHAIYDLKSAVIPWLDNETAAYIAQGFYANNAGIPDEHVSRKEFIFLGKLIANDFVVNGRIDDLLMDDLREKLRNDPDYATYINQIFIGDG